MHPQLISILSFITNEDNKIIFAEVRAFKIPFLRTKKIINVSLIKYEIPFVKNYIISYIFLE